MRTTEENLSTLTAQGRSAQGRFDEASQDVLALAARLQKMHLETMSADEIESAAVEGGMNPEFVREAIRRVSANTDPQVEPEEEQRPASAGEWAVGILVPTGILGFFFLRHLVRAGNLSTGLAFTAFTAMMGLGVLAAVGLRSLLLPQTQARAVELGASAIRRPISVPNAFSVLCQALVIFSLMTVPAEWPHGGLTQAVFLMVMLPLIGAWEPRIKPAFWKGFAYGATLGLLLSVGELQSYGAFEYLPVYTAAFGGIGGLLSLAGHGIRRLVYRPKQAAPMMSARTQMLEQLFELQAALERHQETRAFLSVDVVGSSVMKASGNPLEVEYSFGQYQEWVAQTVKTFGGEVQVSAGDGAMAMFRDARSAIAAAKQLQFDSVDFNANKNRLSTPFRLRCGVAEGKIGIDSRTPLGQIQSPVLDRAAFLQKYGEAGSVVVTQELLEVAMPVLGSLRQRELIDGKPVYFWP